MISSMSDVPFNYGLRIKAGAQQYLTTTNIGVIMSRDDGEFTLIDAPNQNVLDLWKSELRAANSEFTCL